MIARTARSSIRAPSAAAALAIAALLGAGCLPGDTRPTPGSILVTAEPSVAVASGFSTTDGWTITFERLLLAVGDISLDGDACNSYANTHYDRLFDLVASGRQKVGIVYGLGACDLAFRVRSPSTDTLLGPGVSPGDLAMMRTRGTDAFISDQRVSVYVRGHAQRGAVDERFEWSFRDRYSIHDCTTGLGGGAASAVTLEGNEALELHVVTYGEELFRAADDPEAPLVFADVAGADADGDGAITLDELGKAAAPPYLPDGGLGPPPGTGAADAGSDAGGPTLADLIYGMLAPRVARIAATQTCQVDARPRGD